MGTMRPRGGQESKRREGSASARGAIAPAPPKELRTLQDVRDLLASRPNVESMRPSSVDVERAFHLERMNALMDALGNPQRQYKTVHVAGSKGKGSVCEMTAAGLEACGMAVGIYTSPHLVCISERIRIGQRAVSGTDLAGAMSRVLEGAGSLPASLGEITAFELLTAAAFVYFADQAVDIAVIETGLGGRRDATNVLNPEVTAITSIQLEHTQLLGSTLEQIAREKAGIFRKDVPAITLPQPDGVLSAFREESQKVGAPLLLLGRDIDFSSRFESGQLKVSVVTPRSQYEHMVVPLKGEHQAMNCGLALAILDQLRARSIPTVEARVANGLARTCGAGRLEQVFLRPRIFIDGAHNPESIRALMKAIGAQIRFDSTVAVFGAAADKDIDGMLAALATGADKVIFTRAAEHARAADPRDLIRRFTDMSSKMAQVALTVKDALNLAARAVQRDDIILVTGSFAIAGEAKRLLEEKKRAAAPAGVIEEVKPMDGVGRRGPLRDPA